MKGKTLLLKIAGFINLFTAFVHLVGGQLDLVNPMLDSDLLDQAKTEWLACWHVITVLLFGTSYILLRSAFRPAIDSRKELLKTIGYLYLFISIPFVISSFWMGAFAPQWILLIPIGLLTIFGIRKI